jgi:hypothetical protein
VQDAPLVQLSASLAFSQLARPSIPSTFSQTLSVCFRPSSHCPFSHHSTYSFSRWLADGTALVQAAPLVQLPASLAFNQSAFARITKPYRQVLSVCLRPSSFIAIGHQPTTPIASGHRPSAYYPYCQRPSAIYAVNHQPLSPLANLLSTHLPTALSPATALTPLASGLHAARHWCKTRRSFNYQHPSPLSS